MYRVVQLNNDGVARPAKFFHEFAALGQFIRNEIGPGKEYPQMHIEFNNKIAYVLHSTDHPDDYDFGGKSIQQLLDHGVHVMPTNTKQRAMRDVYGLKRRSGDAKVHQVAILEGDDQVEVIYLDQLAVEGVENTHVPHPAHPKSQNPDVTVPQTTLNSGSESGNTQA